MLLIHFGVFCVRCIVIFTQPAIKLQHLATGVLRERHMVLVLAAYPVVTVTVRSILLACTCGYHMQIRISLLWLYIAYDIIESSGTL